MVDRDTGELIQTQVIERVVGDGDAGFHKIWLGHILELVEEVGNAKMVVLVWLLKNADSQNQIYASLREIAKATGVGVATVQRLMAALVSADVVTERAATGLAAESRGCFCGVGPETNECADPLSTGEAARFVRAA